MLKCILCGSEIPRSRVYDHMSNAHPKETAEGADPQVETVPEDDALVTDTCLCGDPIRPGDCEPGDDPWWYHATHKRYDDGHSAIPARDAIKSLRRTGLNDQLVATGKRMNEVRAEMTALRHGFEDAAKRLERAEAAIASPAMIRRATLNQVWDRLADAGQYGAASIVSSMIGIEDWS